MSFDFWTTLIKVTEKPTGSALESLEGNCTYVTGDYYIFEGDLEVLVDDGVVFEQVAEGVVGALGGLTEDELKQVCLDSYGVKL